MLYTFWKMVCFASRRNLGQSEDTSCYLIFLQEPSGGGERSSLLLPHYPQSILENQKRSSRCPSIKATRHSCPFFHVFSPSSWALKRAGWVMGSKAAAVIHELLEDHKHVSMLTYFPLCLLLPDLSAVRTHSKRTDSLRIEGKCGYFWSRRRVGQDEPPQPITFSS